MVDRKLLRKVERAFKCSGDVTVLAIEEQIYVCFGGIVKNKDKTVSFKDCSKPAYLTLEDEYDGDVENKSYEIKLKDPWPKHEHVYASIYYKEDVVKIKEEK